MTGLRAQSQKPGGGTSGDQLSGGNVGERLSKRLTEKYVSKSNSNAT